MQVSITEYLCPDGVLTWNARSKYDQLEDKSQWPNHCNFKYSSTMANGGLCLHLEQFHSTQYLKIGQEMGWVMQLASIKVQIALAMQTAKLSLKQQLPFTPHNIANCLICFIATNDHSAQNGH
jgi:hypothetical protein